MDARMTADPGRSGGEGTGHHFHGIVEGLKVAWPDEACARDNCGEPLLVVDPVTARDTIAREVLSQLVLYTLPANFGRPLGRNETYETVAERCAPMMTDAVLAALASQERGDG